VSEKVVREFTSYHYCDINDVSSVYIAYTLMHFYVARAPPPATHTHTLNERIYKE